MRVFVIGARSRATPGGSVTVGLSLGGFSSLVNTLFEGATVAILVAVQGNSYFNVPVLEFGAEHGEEAAAAARDACPGCRRSTRSATRRRSGG